MSPQRTIAHYRIASKLGEGGMGEVWRATDTKLNRDVAIKILPDTFAADPDRLARFTREAQVLAALNHPNIGAIYGVENRALTLELVDGETLAGPLPEEQLQPVMEQLIDALEYAHDKGIVHRDLKPANLKLTAGGHLKVLDFGLAKAMSGESPAADPASSPTLTMRATQSGLILGTAAYMGPGQARGQAVDRRADIWSFGAVLYELLTGRRVFEGETVSDTLVAVLKTEPDLTAVPARYRRLLRLCLARDPRRRLRDISGARLLLEEPENPPAPAAAQPRRSGWRVAAIGAAVVALASVAIAWRGARTEPQPLLRFSADLGPDAWLDINNGPILSPDGTRLLYYVREAGGEQRLAIRTLGESKASVLSGTEGAPDGAWIAYFADTKLKKIPVQGGVAVTRLDASVNPRGGDFLPDGSIVTSIAPSAGLLRVPAAGGAAVPLTNPRRHNQVTHRWPQVLPGGRFILFTGNRSNADMNNAEIDLLDLETGDWSTVQRGGYSGAYLPSGHLVFAHDGALFAERFDASAGKALGSPVPVLDDLATQLTIGYGRFTFSRSGLFAYVSGKFAGNPRYLAWLDRAGPPTRLPAPPDNYAVPHLSRDARFIAFDLMGATSQQGGLWDVSRGMTIPLMLPATAGSRFPIWAPDGRHLVLRGFDTHGRYGFWWVRADGGGQAVKLWDTELAVMPNSMSPDGCYLLFSQSSPQTGIDIIALPLDVSNPEAPKAGAPQVFVQTRNGEWGGVFSPDGKWVAYTGHSCERSQFFVRPFPGPGGVWPVSIRGGHSPAWSPKGRRLFFLDPDGTLQVVDYETHGDSFVPGKPQPWNDAVITPAMIAGAGPDYDVAADGRVLALLDPAPSGPHQNAHVAILINFFDELKRKVP